MEVTRNKTVGRRKIADLKELLYQEQVWISALSGLRDGWPEMQLEVPGGVGSSMLIKSKDQRGHRSLKVFGVNGQTRQISSRFATEPNEIMQWSREVERAEKEFDDVVTGRAIVPVKQMARPAEKHLFDALMRATTAAQVRRICRRSNDWLKFRWDFPGGGFCQLPSACPRALYEKTEELLSCETRSSISCSG